MALRSESSGYCRASVRAVTSGAMFVGSSTIHDSQFTIRRMMSVDARQGHEGAQPVRQDERMILRFDSESACNGDSRSHRGC
jgi:hypothetical protein